MGKKYEDNRQLDRLSQPHGFDEEIRADPAGALGRWPRQRLLGGDDIDCTVRAAALRTDRGKCSLSGEFERDMIVN